MAKSGPAAAASMNVSPFSSFAATQPQTINPTPRPAHTAAGSHRFMMHLD